MSEFKVGKRKFKVGDRVRYVYPTPELLHGKIGIVAGHDPNSIRQITYAVDFTESGWKGGHCCIGLLPRSSSAGRWCFEYKLEPVKKEVLVFRRKGVCK
jgi:hypothetical protein